MGTANQISQMTPDIADTPSTARSRASGLPADIAVGAVHLTVPDLARSLAFYQRALGLRLQRQDGAMAELGVGAEPLVVLTELPAAERPKFATGLYHLALLVPSRADLARALRHFAQAGVPLQGMSDHAVSEAIYLADPDGNGIEVYADRPRSAWPVSGGEVRMTTDPLDVRALMATLPPDESEASSWNGLPAGTMMGHVHLRGSNLEDAERFYTRVLGFDVTARFGGSAVFLSAGGYHHHLAVNNWQSRGAPPPPAKSAGLRHWRLELPHAADRAALVARARAEGVTVEEQGDVIALRDPAGNEVRLGVRG